VNDAWETLIKAGMPAGAVRREPAEIRDPRRLRSAVRELVEFQALDTWQVAPLLAWLAAFQHHWPSRFRDCLGEVGDAAIDALTVRLDDQNRYLKLRRIAIANLSAMPSPSG
jgi:hypothetical protein